MREMNGSKCQAVDNGSFVVAKGWNKTLMDQPSVEKLFTEWTKGHPNQSKYKEKGQLVAACQLISWYGAVRFRNVYKPIGKRVLIQ